MTARLLVVVALAVFVTPRRSLAQDSAIRADLEQFRTQLSSIDDSPGVRKLEHELGGAGATTEAETIRRLRRGYVRLRIAALGDAQGYSRAAGDFRRATELAPGWSAAWEAQGEALRAESEGLASDRLNLGNRVGFGSLERAMASFARAIQEDPGNTAAIHDLYDAAAQLRDTTRFAEMVLPTLRRAAAEGTVDTSLFLALGRSERLMGDPGAATGAFRRYLERGGSRGLGLRELAWSAFVASDSTADSAYYAAAVQDDSAGILALREDLALVADEQSLILYDRLHPSARGGFLRRFWCDRDRQALRPPGDRLREHYRRITTAERRYGLEVNRRHFSDSDVYHSGSTRFDDRGIVYVRHGDPDQRVSTITYGIQPNESWLYHTADGDLLLHFAANAGGDIRDYRLVASVSSIGGVDASHPDDSAAFFAFNDRCVLYFPYCRYLGWGQFARARIMNEERALVKASAERAVTTDGHSLQFRHQLEAEVAVFVVGRQGDRQLLHVAYRAMPQVESGAPGRAMRVRVNLFDEDGHSVAWIDTTGLLSPPSADLMRPRGGQVGRIQLAVPTGRWRYRVALASDDSTGRVLPTDSVEVGRFDGSRLAISDLVVAKGREGAAWVPQEGDTAYLSPRCDWAQGDTIALYHEIYGLALGTPYGAKLVLRRGRKVALTFRWRGEATGEVTRVSRTLSLAALSPGEYQLEVEITRSDGETARSSRRLKITK